MCADSALQIGLSIQLSKVKKRIWQEIAENIKILHQKYCKKLQEAAEQAKTTEQKREEQSAAGNVLSKVGFHFMMRVDKSRERKNTNKASNLAHCNHFCQILEEKKHKAHLFNLNFDPQLSGRLVHIFQVEEIQVRSWILA